ncbi:MAG: TonB-dependent receptor [Pseudomonadota bacterium]
MISRCVLVAALIICLADMGLSVQAQGSAPSAANAAERETLLDTVLVTAQNRPERAQDLPIVISTFDADDLDRLGPSALQDITQYVPGVELFDERGAGQPTWVIRGVGLADFNANNTPTASIFDDEIYLGSNVLSGLPLFDIERIEVLKGPQGGLYGRNTTGGAVRYLPVLPEIGGARSGFVEAHYGRWDQTGLEAAFSGSINDRVAFRLSGVTLGGGGWQDSLATPEDDAHGDRDLVALRGQLLVQPNDRLSLRFKATYGEDRSETTLGRAVAPFDAETGLPCTAALTGQPDPNTCVTLYNLTTALVTEGADLGVLPNLQDDQGETVLTEPINTLDNRWISASVYLDYAFDGFALRSITSIQDFDGAQIYDFDASPARLLSEDTRSEFQVFQQEFRLISDTQGPLEWQAGINYAQTDLDEDRQIDLSENLIVLPVIARRSFTQEERHWAAYVQGAYDLSPRLRAHGSLRYTEETKDLVNFLLTPESDPFQIFVETPGDVFLGPVNTRYELESPVTGHIGVDYKFRDDALLYAKLVRGYKSGGFFGGFALSALELEPYVEETVWAYEVGAKVNVPSSGLQINSALFSYDYQDVQGFTTAFDETVGVITLLGNLGDAEYQGAELEVVWAPAAIDGLSLSAAATWLDTEIVDSDTVELSDLTNFFDGAPGDPPLAAPEEGQSIGFAPEFSYVLNARYSRAIRETLSATAQVNWSWRSDFAEDGPFLFDDGVFTVDSYGLLSASLSLETTNGWQASLTGQNLTNEAYVTQATGDDLLSYLELPGRPRSWQIRIAKRF